jgi:hypothetical protein
MVHGVSAPGISLRPCFYRYSEDAIDPCEQLGVSVSSVVRFRSVSTKSPELNASLTPPIQDMINQNDKRSN